MEMHLCRTVGRVENTGGNERQMGKYIVGMEIGLIKCAVIDYVGVCRKLCTLVGQKVKVHCG